MRLPEICSYCNVRYMSRRLLPKFRGSEAPSGCRITSIIGKESELLYYIFQKSRCPKDVSKSCCCYRCDSLNLKEPIAGDARYLDQRSSTGFNHHPSAMARWTLHTPCRFMLPKKLLINCVDGPKIIHVLHEDLYSTIRSNVSRTGPFERTKDEQTYRCLDDLPNLAPASLDNTLQILERLSRLRFHTALDECAGFGIEAEASRDEHKGRAHDGLTIWPNRLGCICRAILIAVAPARC
jgi:hypothetical protein